MDEHYHTYTHIYNVLKSNHLLSFSVNFGHRKSVLSDFPLAFKSPLPIPLTKGDRYAWTNVIKLFVE